MLSCPPSFFKHCIRGVVFDMDGTLTVPVIDFQYMRQVGVTVLIQVYIYKCISLNKHSISMF